MSEMNSKDWAVEAAIRQMLWYVLRGGDIGPSDMTRKDIALCRERLEMTVERFGEAAVIEQLQAVCKGMTVTIARTVLDPDWHLS